MSSEMRKASTVMLIRETPDVEILMVKRNYQIDNISGSMVFPGGKIENHDEDPNWSEFVIGWNMVPQAERAPRIAAIRETFEEVGVLLGPETAQDQEIEISGIRKAIDNGEVRFLDYIADRKTVIDLEALTLFARWRTPPVVPKRFDTYFYLTSAPANQVVVSDGRETIEPEWVKPGFALQLAKEGKRSIVFPTRMNLQLLASTNSLANAITAADKRQHLTVEPEIEKQGSDNYINLDPKYGYGPIREILNVPVAAGQNKS